MRLDEAFYRQDVLIAAPALLGKLLCRAEPDGTVRRMRITETEAYRGEEDTACHAHKGKTARTAVMFQPGGVAYIYLCYGIHALLNIVTGENEQPQAALIRSVESFSGPGRLTRAMGIGLDLNGQDLLRSDLLWVEDDGFRPRSIETAPRVGIAYAAQEDQMRPWRYIAVMKSRPDR